MHDINELVGLAQQLDAAMDDAGSVISLNIGIHGHASFLVDTDYFVKHFDSADIIKTGDHEFPFKLENEIEGVLFCARPHHRELELLRGLVPDTWIEEASVKSESAQKVRVHRQKKIVFSGHEKTHSHGHANELTGTNILH